MRPLPGRLPTEEQLQQLHTSLRRRLRQVLQLLKARSTALCVVQQQHDATMHAAVEGCARPCHALHAVFSVTRTLPPRYPGALATLQQTVEASKQLAAMHTSLAASIAEHTMMAAQAEQLQEQHDRAALELEEAQERVARGEAPVDGVMPAPSTPPRRAPFRVQDDGPRRAPERPQAYLPSVGGTPVPFSALAPFKPRVVRV